MSSDNMFVLEFTARHTVKVPVDAYSTDDTPKKIENENAAEVLLDAISAGEADVTARLVTGPQADYEHHNEFWQVQNGQPGCLPDHAEIHTELDAAKDSLKALAEDYEESGYVVEDISEDGRAYAVRRKEDKPSTQQRVLTVEGPLTAQDMGYQSIEQMLEFEDITL